MEFEISYNLINQLYTIFEKSIDILSGLLTPSIAIITVIILHKQYQSNKKQGELKNKREYEILKIEQDKLKLALYNKRYNIFKITKDFLLNFNKDYRLSIEEIAEFKAVTNESIFLFDEEINTYLKEIFNKAMKLRRMTISHDKLEESGFEGKEKIKEIRKDFTEYEVLIKWFTNEYREITENKFLKYLDFRKL
ncbi:MAG: hypothetical protein ABIJ97_03040 [Bacteroidota bacterium]